MTTNPQYHDDDIYVQTYAPPLFTPTGDVIPRKEAWEKGLWYSTANLWVVQSSPEPSIVYQQRSPNIGWAPGKLDVLIAGHCEHLQTPLQTIAQESKEEFNVTYDESKFIHLGRKLAVGVGMDGTVRNSVVNLFLIEDGLSINRFLLQKKEVFAVCSCPLSKLLKVHTDPTFTYKQKAIRHDGQEIELEVNQNIFPENWDPYHYKMALLIDRYFQGERNLIY
jgi:hypothetical protein